MRILFATAERYLPEEFGGAETSVHELIRALVPRGHACEVLASLRARLTAYRYRLWRLLTRRRRQGLEDRKNGYPTYRALRLSIPEALGERLSSFQPDLVVCWNGSCEEIARRAARASVAVILWVPDVGFRWYTGALPMGPRLLLAGSSGSMATGPIASTPGT
jgi:hypothetical protein